VEHGRVVDFAHVLHMLRGFFAGRDAHFAVIGGVGSAAYGIGRTTLDTDIVADADEQDALIAFLESEGDQTLHRSSGC
jgi:hypothetical protein